MWHYATRVIVFYNFIVDFATLGLFTYYVMTSCCTYQFNWLDGATSFLMIFVTLSKLRPTFSTAVHGKESQIFLINPSIPDAPNRRLLAFKKRLYETETS